VRKIHRDATAVSFGAPDDLAAVDAVIHAQEQGPKQEQA
jgi:hypothetical protein